jgi:hypothetical protein
MPISGPQSFIVNAVNSLTHTLCDRCHLRNETNENGMQGTAESNNSGASVAKTCMAKSTREANNRIR